MYKLDILSRQLSKLSKLCVKSLDPSERKATVLVDVGDGCKDLSKKSRITFKLLCFSFYRRPSSGIEEESLREVLLSHSWIKRKLLWYKFRLDKILAPKME